MTVFTVTETMPGLGRSLRGFFLIASPATIVCRGGAFVVHGKYQS